ncbi:small integral membrane protein 12-A [Harmonia axyridis]|uniref:small integral membrane protein 12-A n=1 Tax=Harmonia axyridis TaxID=115357 RepID=UPI001E27618F|nr:small integral membrane protein 12-A [Harmonia axyridis]XP_045462098.1 small integral membrane protein 12-A [Harmonia axyridis]XP_045462099.1 small integral membrane protein 12-A [Harmonia axyridis]
MWPILMRVASRYAPYITLPFAGVVGFIGYNLENWLSDKYTPYHESIKESRGERLLSDEALLNSTEVVKLKPSGKALDRNLSPSLQ